MQLTPPPAVRSCLAVTASVLVFAGLVERAGLVPAVVLTVHVAALGSPRTTLSETFVMALILAVAMSVLFVWVLRQPFAVFAGY